MFNAMVQMLAIGEMNMQRKIKVSAKKKINFDRREKFQKWPKSQLNKSLDALICYRNTGLTFRSMSRKLFSEYGIKIHHTTIFRFLEKLLHL